MTKLTWSLAPETGGVLVSIQQTSRANGQDYIGRQLVTSQQLNSRLLSSLFTAPYPACTGFDLALL
jgi:hypothetical protein